MNKETEFCEGVKNYLNVLDQDIQVVLKKLIQYNYPNEVIWLNFEIFADGFTSEFPVRSFFIDKDNSEFFVYVDGKAKHPSPIDPGLLNIPYVYPEEFVNKYTEADEDFDPYHFATKELIKWFSQMWLKAGGDEFQLDATIGVHDYIEEFNLMKSEWQERQ